MHLVVERLRRKGLQVIKEPHITTNSGVRIPDIVAYNSTASYVLDVQVCADTNTILLADAHKMKVDKYNVPEVSAFVEERTGVSPTFSSITVN